MPNDAKLGLVVGVSLVIVVAVFFFRKEPPAVDPAAATIVKPMPDLMPPRVRGGNGRPVQLKATSQSSVRAEETDSNER